MNRFQLLKIGSCNEAVAKQTLECDSIYNRGESCNAPGKLFSSVLCCRGLDVETI